MGNFEIASLQEYNFICDFKWFLNNVVKTFNQSYAM